MGKRDLFRAIFVLVTLALFFTTVRSAISSGESEVSDKEWVKVGRLYLKVDQIKYIEDRGDGLSLMIDKNWTLKLTRDDSHQFQRWLDGRTLALSASQNKSEIEGQGQQATDPERFQGSNSQPDSLPRGQGQQATDPERFQGSNSQPNLGRQPQ